MELQRRQPARPRLGYALPPQDGAGPRTGGLRDENGRRPVHGGTAKFQEDPHWRDLILFYEYFHGDNGAGLGASHQTGWTGGIAVLLDLFGRLDAADVLMTPKERIMERLVREQVGGKD